MDNQQKLLALSHLNIECSIIDEQLIIHADTDETPDENTLQKAFVNYEIEEKRLEDTKQEVLAKLQELGLSIEALQTLGLSL